MSKRILSLVLALVMVLGSVPFAFAAESDVPEQIQWLVDNGYVLGDEGGLRLNDTIRRAEVAVVVAKALGLEDAAAAAKNVQGRFKDVTPTNNFHWANGYINVLSGKGIINGYPDGTFKPANNVTVQEVATIMVMAIDGKAPEGTYPFNMIVRATELGLFNGVDATNYAVAATRHDTFMMIYNAINTLKMGDHDIVKAIVLENDRVEKLDENEIVIEVIAEIQRSKFADESREIEGAQYNLVLPAKFDVENLLGKVVDFTVKGEIKDGKEVLEAKVDETYKVVTGPVTATKNKLTVGSTSYTVELDERYKGSDERVYRTYFNNKAYSYENFYKEVKDADFARVTVKNGKVFFIDAYDFDDIAPVKEVKKDGKEVYVYNDYRDARVEKYEPKLVIGYTEKGGFTRISASDIESLDVVHVYNDKYMIVRLDADLTGTYEKVSQNSDGYWVHVDGEKYFINDANYIRPVYSINGEDFETLYVRSASSDLRDLKDEEVTIALDINGDLQYLTGAIDYNETVAVIDNILSKGDVRYILPNNEKLVLEETFDSELYVKGTPVTTNNQRMSRYDIGDLVFVIKDKDTIDVMNKLVPVADIKDTSKTYPVVYNATDKAYKMTKDYLIVKDGAQEVRYNVISDTNVFIVNFDGSEVSLIKGTTMKDVIDNVKADSGLRAYVLTTQAYANINDGLYRDKLPQKANNVAHTIIFTNYVEKSSYDTEIIEVTAKYYPGSSRVIEGKYANDETVTRTVSKNATLPTINVGDIVKLSITKDDDKLVAKAKVLIKNDEGTFKIVDIDPRADYRWIKLQDAKGVKQVYWLTSDVKEFGTIALDQVIRFETNAAGDIYVIKSLGRKADVTGTFDGSLPPGPGKLVTYINVEEHLIEVDGEVLELHSRVRLIDADGKTLAIGPKEVASKLEKGMKVELTEEKGIVTEIKLAKEKDPVDPKPEPGEEITATYEAKLNPIAQKYAVAIDLSDVKKNDKVTVVKIDGKDYGIEIFEERILVNGVFDKKPSEVKVVVEGKTITATEAK